MAEFELLEEKILGKGSFGKVYQCYWYGSLAAAKLFNIVKEEELSKDIEMIKKLRNENIIQFFGTAHRKSKFFLITSYAEKGSLLQALDRHILSVEQKSIIIRGLINGMAYLKSSNVVHGGLKSSNVLLDSHYVPKISDFGLTRYKQESATCFKTPPPSTTGTVRWMAPELFEIQPCYTFASDVYALGLVIWEIFTEKLPYADSIDDVTISDLVKAGEHEEITSSIPEHYKSILKDCWRLDPKGRIQVEEMCNLSGDIFEYVSVPSEPQSIVSGSTSSHQQSEDLSPYVLYVITAYYEYILNQYLQDITSNLMNKSLLASVLREHGDSFIFWIVTEAKIGRDAAATVLGEMYYHGCGVPMDYRAAMEQFSMAAKEKTCDQNGTGIKRLSMKDTKKGNARAQNNIGQMYHKGQGVPQSDNEAVAWFTKAAEQGDAYAQLNLGVIYENGRGVPQSDDKAFAWYMRAAEQDNTSAQYNLGNMYMNGQGVPQNDDKAIEWYMKASDQGDVDAQVNLGWMHEKGRGVPQNDEKAVEWYTKAAEQGDAYAQVNLGWMHENGRGVPQSDEKAVEWYVKASEQSNARAQCSLGTMYLNGQGVPQSYDKAIELYMKAAEQDGSMAQNYLGNMYKNGQGVPQSDDKAAEWYTKAAELGHADAQVNLGWMYANGRGVPQNNDIAIKWYTKAAEQGNARAQHNLGWMYESGRGVLQSDIKAFEWYTKAAEQGDARDQYNLGWMYEFGRGILQSDSKAFEWYTKAAEQDDVAAQCCLGEMYEDGQGVPQSDDKAAEWYTKAAEQGNVSAQYNLGRLYENGRGVPQNDNKAVAWYTKAAEQGNTRAKLNLETMYKNGRGVP